MIDRGVIGTLIDYYMGEYSPIKRPGRVKIGDKLTVADLHFFMDLLASLTISVETRSIRKTKKIPPHCYPDCELSWAPHRCMQFLLNKVCYCYLHTFTLILTSSSVLFCCCCCCCCCFIFVLGVTTEEFEGKNIE